MHFPESRFDSNRLIKSREIRLFISSTFIDLDEERTALLKVFKSIQLEALKRNVYFTVIDLRWGITEAESRGGKVLPVCLKEIENSHPFFIGLLGNRYGYTPTEEELDKNQELIERYPWIREDIKEGRSITEIEMQYGALRRNEDTYAFFFLKESVDVDDNPKLTLLKKKIVEQNKYPASYFHSVEDLCNKVEKTLTSIIDEFFPKDLEADSEPDYQIQESYLNELTRFYLKNPKDFDALNSFVEKKSGKHMIVSGERGIGKSALLANWILEKRKEGWIVLPDFIGYSLPDTTKEKVLLRLYDGLCSVLNMQSDRNRTIVQKDEVEKLMALVAASGKKVVIVIDGINQLNVDHDSLFSWFPMVARGVKVVLSTEESDPIIKTFVRKELPVYHLGPLSLECRRDFITSYLSIYGKKLNSGQIDRILANPQNANTQILKTLLNELVSFGSHDQLDNRIDYYLSANSFGDFYNRVLDRVETTYSGNQDLVRRTLSQIYLSKEGLSASEIIEMNSFREMDWRLFYCDFYNSFISRKGLLTFSDKMLAQAICQRYHLDNRSNCISHRKIILGYFKSIPDNHRKTLELAYQYCQLDDVKELHTVALDFLAFQRLYEDDSRLLADCWKKMMDSKKGYSLLDYLRLPRNDISKTDLPFYQIGSFVNMYFPDFSLQLKYYKVYLSIEPETFFRKNTPLAAAVYSDVAACYGRIGDFESALKLYDFLLDHVEDQTKKDEIYLQMGTIFDYQREFGKAIDYYKLVINSSNAIGPWTLASGYNGLAGVYKNMREYRLSLEYYFKARLLYEEYYGESVAEMVCGTGIGYVYGKMHKPKEALEYLEKALRQMSDYYGETHMGCFLVLENIASVYLNNGDGEKALKTLLQIIETFESSDFNFKTWSKVYRDVGQLYSQKGNNALAVKYYKKALEKESAMNGESEEMAALCGSISSCFFQMGELQKAVEYLEKSAMIYEKLGVFSEKVLSMYKAVSVLYRATGEIEKAENYYEKALAFYCKQLLNKSPKQEILVYEDLGADEKIKDVIDFLRVAPVFLERGLRKVIDNIEESHPFAIAAYKCIGAAYFDKQDYGKALEAVQRIIYIIDKYYPKSDLMLWDCCYKAAGLCKVLNKPDEALQYCQRALGLIKGKANNDNENNLKLLSMMGSLYLSFEDYPQALSVYEKAMDIFDKLEMTPDFDTLFSMGIAYDHVGDLDASIDYYRRAFEVIGEIIHHEDYPKYKITVLAKIGSLYYKKKELYIAYEYFLEAAHCYTKNGHDSSQRVDAANSSASAAMIAIELAKEAVATQNGYDKVLERLKDSYECITTFVGSTAQESLELKSWIRAIEKKIYDSLPWYRKLFRK